MLAAGFTIRCWQGGAGRPAAPRHTPQQQVPEPSAEQDHLQQVLLLEKQLLSNRDEWRGGATEAGLFSQELSKRNTFMLYAVTCDAQVEPPQGPFCQQQQGKAAAAGPHAHVLGFIVVQLHSVTAHIRKLAVAAGARRLGLGTTLLQAALQVALAEQRVLAVTLRVRASNAAALALYAKAGFKQDGVIEDYYGPGCDAYTLRLDDLRDADDDAHSADTFLAGCSPASSCC